MNYPSLLCYLFVIFQCVMGKPSRKSLENKTLYDAIENVCPAITTVQGYKEQKLFDVCKDWKAISEVDTFTFDNKIKIHCLLYFDAFTQYCNQSTLDKKTIFGVPRDYDLVTICEYIKTSARSNIKKIVANDPKCENICKDEMGIRTEPVCSISFYYAHVEKSKIVPANQPLPQTARVGSQPVTNTNGTKDMLGNKLQPHNNVTNISHLGLNSAASNVVNGPHVPSGDAQQTQAAAKSALTGLYHVESIASVGETQQNNKLAPDVEDAKIKVEDAKIEVEHAKPGLTDAIPGLEVVKQRVGEHTEEDNTLGKKPSANTKTDNVQENVDKTNVKENKEKVIGQKSNVPTSTQNTRNPIDTHKDENLINVQDTKDMESVQETKDLETVQETKDLKTVQETKDLKTAQETKTQQQLQVIKDNVNNEEINKQLSKETEDTDLDDTEEEIGDTEPQVRPPQPADVENNEKASKPENLEDSDIPTNYATEMEGDSYFFTYFMLLSIIFILGYICYHNKQKILALILEGRRGKRHFRGRRPNSANYHKLDSNLEEAITSSCKKNASNVIY